MHYLVSVIDTTTGTTGSADQDEMAAIGAFNEQLDVAIELAAEGSRACRRKVEVRPFL